MFTGGVGSYRGCRLKMNRGSDGLSQPVQHVRPQSRRALKKIAEQEDIETNFRCNPLQRPSAAMDGPAQVAAQRILDGRLVKSLTAFQQFR